MSQISAKLAYPVCQYNLKKINFIKSDANRQNNFQTEEQCCNANKSQLSDLSKDKSQNADTNKSEPSEQKTLIRQKYKLIRVNKNQTKLEAQTTQPSQKVVRVSSQSPSTQDGLQVSENKIDFKTRNLRIQNFQQVKILGQGVYGTVSLSRHIESNCVVALKKIQKSSINAGDYVYLSSQIKIQSFLSHPNIVQLYSFFHNQESIYLVLQICNQGNLLSILERQKGRITEERVKKYMKQICKAIEFLHEKQIIHRDIKPQNILVHNGVAKICDFGWSVYAPELRNTLCGTPLYSCPEMVKNEKYDEKVDIWTIGIMTYQFLYGQVPFNIQSLEDLYKVVDDSFDYPEDTAVSEECKNFINRCLQKNPKDRFEVWQLLKHPILSVEQKIRDSLRLSLTVSKI